MLPVPVNDSSMSTDTENIGNELDAIVGEIKEGKALQTIQEKKIKKYQTALTKKQRKELTAYNESKTTPDIINNFRLMDKELLSHLTSKRNDGLTFLFINDGTSAQATKMILPLREQLINELDIKATSELMLLDSSLINYNRFLIYQHWISRILDGGINSENALSIERLNKMSDSALNQYKVGIETLKSMKITSVKLNIKNSQVNVGSNQQILKVDGKTDNFGRLEK